MSKISCDTCLDLIPLVKDGVGSQDSRKLVEDHIETCPECKEVYLESKQIELEDLEIDYDGALTKIKRKLYALAGFILIIGSLVGVSLNDSENMFYNILIMPLLGGVAYLVFAKKAFIMSIFIFIITFIRQATYGYLEGFLTNSTEILQEATPISIVFVMFFFVGIVILKLLNIAIYGGKENRK